MNNLTPDAASPLASWLSYLEQLHAKPVDLGLTRVRAVADALNLLRPAKWVTTVAGTNGKGTTCRTLECILMAAGYRVGVYSSPHLVRYTERVRIQGAELPESDHTASFVDIERGRGQTSLTWFEYGTLSALWLFKRARLDVVILEVGLGGRLDATNIIDADVAVITSIALDHIDYLGPDRESIGREKAGIFRAGRPAVVGEPDMPHSIADVAQAEGAHLCQRGVAWDYRVEEQSWHYRDGDGEVRNLPLPRVPQPNAATAVAALRFSGLAVDDEALRQGLREATLPGRFQVVSETPRVIFDVAHNPHAAAYLACQLARAKRPGRLLTVIGMLHDKDIPGTLACLKPLVDCWYCATLTGPRGASASELKQYLPEAAAFASVAGAWQAAIAAATPQDTVLVCGSFHTVAQVMKLTGTEKTGGE